MNTPRASGMVNEVFQFRVEQRFSLKVEVDVHQVVGHGFNPLRGLVHGSVAGGTGEGPQPAGTLWTTKVACRGGLNRQAHGHGATRHQRGLVACSSFGRLMASPQGQGVAHPPWSEASNSPATVSEDGP